MRDRCDYTAEIGAINKVSVVIFANRDHKRRRCRAGDIDNDWIRAAQIGVAAIERLPTWRHPIIRGGVTENRPGLETNDCLAAAPWAGSAGGVPSRDDKGSFRRSRCHRVSRFQT